MAFVSLAEPCYNIPLKQELFGILAFTRESHRLKRANQPLSKAHFVFLQVRDETNLASSSVAETGDANDLLGVIVSYSIKVKIILSGMGGELEVDLPFKLMAPRPGKQKNEVKFLFLWLENPPFTISHA